MGATVITNKAAGVLVHNGETIYVLFEETYEKNCYPHTPHWGAWCSGTIDSIIRFVYRCGLSCEGGMLQTRSGHLSPESYIRGWQAALATPLAISEQKILRFGRRYSDDKMVDRMIAVCEKVGDTEAAGALRQGLQVHRQITSPTGIALLTADIPAYRLDLHLSDLQEDAPHAAYRPKKASESPMTLPVISVMKKANGGSVVLQRSEKGAWINLGASYRAIGGFVRQLADNELAYPGTSLGLLKAFRAKVDEARRLDVSAVVFKAIPETCSRYRKESYLALLSTLGIEPGGKLPLGEVMAALGDEDYPLFDLSEISMDKEYPALIEFEGDIGSIRAPKYVKLQPVPGLQFAVGDVSYVLSHSLGRKGWAVSRCSDNLQMRISARFLANVLRKMSEEAHAAAVQAAEKAASATQPLTQQELFA